jgi:2-polyprenyl-3-methyl-5-hydroxy-6-metoxy-1,4-benzoquinol methylase
MKDIYLEKELSYYSSIRLDLISLLPEDPSQKILEIGAARGDTLVAIKQNKLASEVIGIDLFSIPNSNQKNVLIDKFIVANLENDQLDLSSNHFDVIIAGDVLEHLVDPWKVIEKITPFLKKGGLFIISVPNLREIVTISKIFFGGSFKYDPEGGIMDKTHLRFFCKKNVTDLFSDKEYKIIKIKPLLDVVSKKSIRKTINNITLNIFEEFLTSQYVAIAQKK